MKGHYSNLTLSIIMSSCFFSSIPTSNSFNLHKNKTINRNQIIFIIKHQRKYNNRQGKPKNCIWFKNCLSVFIRGTIISSSLISFNPNAEAVSYPCQNLHDYYSGIDGLSGDALKKKLGSIVYKHKSLPYKLVWEALKMLDSADVDHPEAAPEVIEIYSQKSVSKELAGKTDGWNREHLWPRSYGLKKAPSLTDLHNLRPADANVNSSRGNKYYGECTNISTHCSRPANMEAASDTETDKHTWAPPLKVRGDIARSVLYMAVCYGFIQPDGIPYLQVSDTPNFQRREMGVLSILVKWNELDPPSREEKLRNDRICELYQHNRNPFVDHPEYVNLIWTRNDSKLVVLHSRSHRKKLGLVSFVGTTKRKPKRMCANLVQSVIPLPLVQNSKK